MNDLRFLRHAQTELAGTFCGHTDPPLNALGHLQLQTALAELASEPFDAVYTSDLRRAHSTATAFATFLAIPCITRPALRELDFGAWEGLTWAEIETRDPAFATLWLNAHPHLPAPGGERFSAFESRVLTELDFLLHQQAYPRILVVTHAGVLRVILQTHCGLSAEEAWARTSSYCSNFRYPIPSPQNAAPASMSP